MGFDADGDLVLVQPTAIYRLDPDLEILSVDSLESSGISGIHVLPNGDVITGGGSGGQGLLRRLAGCEP